MLSEYNAYGEFVNLKARWFSLLKMQMGVKCVSAHNNGECVFVNVHIFV